MNKLKYVIVACILLHDMCIKYKDQVNHDGDTKSLP